MDDLDSAIKLDSGFVAARFNRASLHEVMGNRQLAVADLQRFLDIAPSQQWKDAAKKLLQQWKK